MTQQSTEEQTPSSCQTDVSGSLRFSERDVDFAYLCGVFNVSGIDGLHKEIQRLKAIGKDPHDIIEACRKHNLIKSVCPSCGGDWDETMDRKICKECRYVG